MAHDTASSSSQEGRGSRFECPADFVPVQFSLSEKAVLETGANTELWLIKAPAHFNPSSLADLKLSLSGLEMIQPTDASPQIYSVLSSRSGPADLHLLTSSGKNASPCASGFTGILSISETYGDCSGNQCPIPVPAAPAPSFPPGLKQRFQPFGSSTAARGVQCTTTCLPPKKVKLESEESGVQNKKKKKKKKKEKHSREEETIEVAHIKQEEISSEYGELQVPEPVEEDASERKTKKKIKKEKERKDAQNEVAVDASLIAKQEPMDTSFGDMESSVKKKKKKKKKAHDE